MINWFKSNISHFSHRIYFPFYINSFCTLFTCHRFPRKYFYPIFQNCLQFNSLKQFKCLCLMFNVLSFQSLVLENKLWQPLKIYFHPKTVLFLAAKSKKKLIKQNNYQWNNLKMLSNFHRWINLADKIVDCLLFGWL